MRFPSASSYAERTPFTCTVAFLPMDADGCGIVTPLVKSISEIFKE
jgi:hypothetical protein